MSQKYMAFIRPAGEAFRGHSRAFGAGGGLQDLKKVETNRLLDFQRAALCALFPDILDADIAPTPEIVKILLLRGKQWRKPLAANAVHGPFGATAELGDRSSCGGVIDHEFGKLDRTAGPGYDRERSLTEVLGLDDLVRLQTIRFEDMIDCAYQGQTALLGRVAQHDPTVLGIAALRV